MTSPVLIAAPPARTADEEAIVATADTLFAVEGVTPVSMERIASDAHVPLIALRAAFPTKRELVVAALQNRHQHWMAGLTAAEQVAADPRDRLLTVFTYLEQCFADDSYRGCAFINGYGELGRQDPVIRQLADDHLRQVEQHVAMLCDAAALPAHLAPALTLLLRGAQVEAAIHDTVQPARTARTAAAMLIAVYDIDAERF
ncbi:TetR/AcrR family transcriptional regulator [Curtobacterium sp. MCSS17_008]|uniref:TetR/AcrR family transcriptional regulator n=1 Tax=Curtobacterium sp. MCSS17_008 TaxID=2175647 RepID=UPI000DA7DB43|nr:TetR family transcriptional regulator [Curtobacterium sp. MCSS17_008]PZF57244.1 TetR/AcrR family transcriptional regulator [Curtobacterium sp. MCSS17_008]